jgi:hypothetical protein
VCQIDLPPLYFDRYIVLFLHKDLVLESYLEVEVQNLLDFVGLSVSAFTFGTLLYCFEMCLFSLPYMTAALICQFYLHFVLDKGTHIGT